MAEETKERQPFSEWLGEQRRGALDDELPAAMNEVVEQVTLLGRKGTITLKLAVTPQATGVVVVTDDVIAKPPKEDRPGAVWFVDRDSNLSRNDRSQPTLPSMEEPKK